MLAAGGRAPCAARRRGGAPQRAAAPRAPAPLAAHRPGRACARTRRPRLAPCHVATPTSDALAAAPAADNGGGGGAAAGGRLGAQQLPPVPQLPLSFAGRPGLYDGRGRLMLKCLTLPELEEWCESIGEAPRRRGLVGRRARAPAGGRARAGPARARGRPPGPAPAAPESGFQTIRTAGESRRRATQIWRWMYADDNWASAPEDTIGVQNGFSAPFCDKVRGLASFDGGLRLKSVVAARDGTRKLVFELTEGEGKGEKSHAFERGGPSMQGGNRYHPRRLAHAGVENSAPSLAQTQASSQTHLDAHTLPRLPAAPGGSVEAVLIPVVREAGSKPRITLCVSSQVRRRRGQRRRARSWSTSACGLIPCKQ